MGFESKSFDLSDAYLTAKKKDEQFIDGNYDETDILSVEYVDPSTMLDIVSFSDRSNIDNDSVHIEPEGSEHAGLIKNEKLHNPWEGFEKKIMDVLNVKGTVQYGNGFMLFLDYGDSVGLGSIAVDPNVKPGKVTIVDTKDFKKVRIVDIVDWDLGSKITFRNKLGVDVTIKANGGYVQPNYEGNQFKINSDNHLKSFLQGVGEKYTLISEKYNVKLENDIDAIGNCSLQILTDFMKFGDRYDVVVIGDEIYKLGKYVIKFEGEYYERYFGKEKNAAVFQLEFNDSGFVDINDVVSLDIDDLGNGFVIYLKMSDGSTKEYKVVFKESKDLIDEKLTNLDNSGKLNKITLQGKEYIVIDNDSEILDVIMSVSSGNMDFAELIQEGDNYLLKGFNGFEKKVSKDFFIENYFFTMIFRDSETNKIYVAIGGKTILYHQSERDYLLVQDGKQDIIINSGDYIVRNKSTKEINIMNPLDFKKSFINIDNFMSLDVSDPFFDYLYSKYMERHSNNVTEKL